MTHEIELEPHGSRRTLPKVLFGLGFATVVVALITLQCLRQATLVREGPGDAGELGSPVESGTVEALDPAPVSDRGIPRDDALREASASSGAAVLVPTLRELAQAVLVGDGSGAARLIEALRRDPHHVDALIGLFLGGTLAEDEELFLGARCLLQASLIIEHSESGDPLEARRIAVAVLYALPGVAAPRRAELIEALAMARVGDRVVIGMDYLRELLDLRLADPTLRAELGPLISNLAEDAREGEGYEAFHALLMSDASDPLAVSVGIAGLLRAGGDAFLPLAEEFLREADAPELRDAVLQSIASAAGTDAAADIMARMGRPTDFAPLLTIAAREGGGEALERAYERLLVSGDTNPEARRALVTGMHGIGEQKLLSIARRDPDPLVRGQALITWSASHEAGPQLLRSIREEIDDGRAGGSQDSLCFAISAAGNVLSRASGKSRAEAREMLLGLVLDDSASDLARRTAYERLAQHAPGALPEGFELNGE